MDTNDLHLAGVVDPARYSDRAVAVIEIDQRWVDDLEDYDFGDFKEGVEQILGMRALLLVGSRLARIEEPT